MYTFTILWLPDREYFTLFLKGYYLLSKAKNEWLKEPLAGIRTETSRYCSFPIVCFFFSGRTLILLDPLL